MEPEPWFADVLPKLDLGPLSIEFDEIEPEDSAADAYLTLRWNGRGVPFVAEVKNARDLRTLRYTVVQARKWAEETGRQPLVVPYLNDDWLAFLRSERVSGLVIEYVEARFPERPRTVVYGVQLPEDAASAPAARFGASVLDSEDPVTCTGAPQTCSLAGDNSAVIQAKVVERSDDSAIAEVTLYEEVGDEVFRFVRLELSRRMGS